MNNAPITKPSLSFPLSLISTHTAASPLSMSTSQELTSFGHIVGYYGRIPCLRIASMPFNHVAYLLTSLKFTRCFVILHYAGFYWTVNIGCNDLGIHDTI